MREPRVLKFQEEHAPDVPVLPLARRLHEPARVVALYRPHVRQPVAVLPVARRSEYFPRRLVRLRELE